MKKVFTTLVLLLACAAMSFAADTYTVAGSDDTLFGTVWDASYTDNDMTQYGKSEVYTWRKTGVTLTAGTVQFKVCVNHGWDTAYPGENYSLTIPSNGTYDVTIIFNSTTNDIRVSLSTDTWTAAGDDAVFGKGWDITDEGSANLLTTTDGVTFTLTKANVTLTPGTYNYKVVKNHSWDNENYGAGAVWGGANQSFTVETEGIYDVAITFNYGTKALSEVATLKQAFTYKYRVKEWKAADSWDDLGEMTTVTEGDNKDKEATLTVTRTFDAATTIKFKVAKQLYYGETYQSETWLTGGDESTDWHATIDVAKASKYNITFNVYFSTNAIYGSAEEQFTGYNLITNEGAENAWIKGSALAESEGVYSISFSKANKMFAIAPNTAFDASDNITWANVVRPVTAGDDWAVNYFVNYSGTTQSLSEGGKVWAVAEGNTSTLTLTYTPDENKFTVTTDATETVTIGATGYATYSNDVKYTVEGATANFVTVSGDVATLVPLAPNAVLPAKTVTNAAGKNSGVILSGSGNVTIKPVDMDAEVVEGVSANLLAGSGNYQYDITGYFGSEPYEGYIFANGENGVGFYRVSENNTLAAHKAFLAIVPEATSSNPAPSFIGFDFSNPTAIESIEVAKEGVKNAFNLAGQRVARPTKGLYIVNGRKVVLK